MCPNGNEPPEPDFPSSLKLNRLAQEKSPYLLQHAGNPVYWYPWGDEAWRRARAENKPVFLSIGYSTCHWCHVMAHESFEDDEIAAVLNEYFIAIKVDREERPDLDQLYMKVCQAMTGHGGWPLSVFLAPSSHPFFAGTYFPKEARLGLPGFKDLLQRVAGLWENEQAKLLRAGEDISRNLSRAAEAKTPVAVWDEKTLDLARRQLARAYDEVWGGFGSRPKFPTPHHLTFLLRQYPRSKDNDCLRMVEQTLTQMRQGGICDHIGFGFHRYSVDEKWLVPHFEKMLYDQAQLAFAYLEAFQVSGRELFARSAREIFTYVLRDLSAPGGGFYSAEDADSEGYEGKFYIWTPDEIYSLLGKKTGALFCRVYDIQPGGNFEDGFSIPHLIRPMEIAAQVEGITLRELEAKMEEARRLLFAAREKRIRPLKDDKVICSWNGLMIAAFAKGYQVLGDQEYLQAACRAADFILKSLKTPEGKLLRRFCRGEAAFSAYLDDYAFLVWGLIELYEASFVVRYLKEALALNRLMLELFSEGASGGLFFTGKDHESLIARSRDAYDGALPSGNSIAALNMIRLGRLTGDPQLETAADHLVNAFSHLLASAPSAFTQFLAALDFILGPSREIVVSGDPALPATRELVEVVQRSFLPNKALLLRPEAGPDLEQLKELAPFTRELLPLQGRPTVYLCEKYSCRAPITEPKELIAALKSNI